MSPSPGGIGPVCPECTFPVRAGCRCGQPGLSPAGEAALLLAHAESDLLAGESAAAVLPAVGWDTSIGEFVAAVQDQHPGEDVVVIALVVSTSARQVLAVETLAGGTIESLRGVRL